MAGWQPRQDTKECSYSYRRARASNEDTPRRAEHDFAGHSSRSSSLGEQLQPQSCSKAQLARRARAVRQSRRDVHECV